MTDKSKTISAAFKTFMSEAPEHAQAWGSMVGALGGASALEAKTSGLAYIAVLAALNRVSGIPFHVISDFQGMHYGWKQVFSSNYPVRTTITSDFVDEHCLIQIEGVAGV